MHTKKSTILFSVQYILLLSFSVQIFSDIQSRNVNDLPKNSHARCTQDAESEKKYFKKITEKIEQLRQKRAELFEQRNFIKKFSTEEIFSIVEYIRVSKRLFRKTLFDKLTETKRTCQHGIDDFKSYLLTLVQESDTESIVVTEQGLLQLPNIHKAHVAAAWGIGGSAAVPIVAAVRNVVGGGNSSSAGNPVPAQPAPSTKAPVSQPQAPQGAKKSSNSRATHGSIPLSSSTSGKHPDSFKPNIQPQLTQNLNPTGTIAPTQKKATSPVDRLAASDKTQVVPDKLAEQDDRIKFKLTDPAGLTHHDVSAPSGGLNTRAGTITSQGTGLTATGPLGAAIGGAVLVGHGAKYAAQKIQERRERKLQASPAYQQAQRQEAEKQKENFARILSQRDQEVASSRHLRTYVTCDESFRGQKIDFSAIDLLNKKSNYSQSSLQRLSDLSSSVLDSKDKIAVVDNKIIKFTYDVSDSNSNGHYTASVVQDFSSLSEHEQNALRKDWNFDVQEHLKKRDKPQQNNRQRKNDVNRHNNSGPGKDPDKEPNKSGKIAATTATGKAADEIRKNMKYTGNPKHHINSKGNVSKPPHNGQKTLEESIYVNTDLETGLSNRVAIENGKVVKFHEHAPGEFHGYIEENIKQMPEIYKKALYKNGLIRSVKSCKVRK